MTVEIEVAALLARRHLDDRWLLHRLDNVSRMPIVSSWVATLRETWTGELVEGQPADTIDMAIANACLLADKL